MIKVINLKIGNIGSISRALSFLKIRHEVSSNFKDLSNATKIILPGVGSFSKGMEQIEELNYRDAINEAVLNRKVPILGICLGMQLLCLKGHEGGESLGLGLINGEVEFMAKENKLKVPHVGWNDVRNYGMRLFRDIQEEESFYFVHSYKVKLNENISRGVTDYGEEFISTYEKDNIYGVQFHPEKSQKSGLKLIQNFCELC